MEPTTQPAGTPPAAARRVVARTFAQREDADRAAGILLEHGITSEVRPHFLRNTVANTREERGCSLLVEARSAQEAARLLLRMPPSEAAATTSTRPATARDRSASGSGSGRLIRRVGKPAPQRSAVGIIIIALLGAAGAIIFGYTAVSSFQRRNSQPPAPEPVAITVTEDLNGDSIPDLERTFSSNGQLQEIRQDRDCDGTWDARWLWQNKRLDARDLDIDDDGKWDERTHYDPDGFPFVSDLRPGGSGSLSQRRIYRDGILWRTLTNYDKDLNFDHVRDQDETGDVLRDEPLPPGAPENAMPKYPLEPLPLRDEETIRARTGAE